MEMVGAFAAKTHLAQLIERAARGESFVITNRGKPVAMLVPPKAPDAPDTAEVGRAMLRYRDQVQRKLGGGSFRDMAHEGHRC